MPISLDNGFLDNDSEFSSLHEYNYPKKLELKLEYQGEHTTFLDLDITAEENIFVYKLFEKFPFFIVCLISQAIFHHQFYMVKYF